MRNTDFRTNYVVRCFVKICKSISIVERLLLSEGNPMSRVFHNIDPSPPSPPGECVLPPPPTKAGGTHSPGEEGGGGSIFWKTRDIGLPSYSNNLSTSSMILYNKTVPAGTVESYYATGTRYLPWSLFFELYLASRISPIVPVPLHAIHKLVSTRYLIRYLLSCTSASIWPKPINVA